MSNMHVVQDSIFEQITFDMLIIFGMISSVIVCLLLLILIIVGLYNYKITLIKKHTEVPKIKAIDVFSRKREFKNELESRLDNIFDRLILRKYIIIFIQFKNMSDENRKEARRQFTRAVEIDLDTLEKVALDDIYGSFSRFQVVLFQYFEDRMTKLELLLVNDDKSITCFSDGELYKNLIDSSGSNNENKKLEEILKSFD